MEICNWKISWKATYLLKLSSIKKSEKSVYLNTGLKSNLVAVIPCEGYGGFFVFKILPCFADI